MSHPFGTTRLGCAKDYPVDLQYCIMLIKKYTNYKLCDITLY